MRSKAWVFTLNNPESEDEVKDMGHQYLVYGRETGENWTPHLQGYVYFKNQRTLASLKKKLPRAHWEARKGSHDQAKEYCMKDGDYYEDGVEPQKHGGDNLQQKAMKNKRLLEAPLKELVDGGELSVFDVKRLKQAKDILANENQPYNHDDVRVYWFYGPPGTGKTFAARHRWGSAFYIKPQNKWFDGYAGEETIVLDDLDKGGACLGHYLKIWADKWACNGEVKGGTVPLRHKRFIVTSNYQPDELWGDDNNMLAAITRRFKEEKFLIKYID